MVYFTHLDKAFKLQPDEGGISYINTLAYNLSEKCLEEEYTNVTISCKGVKFELNHMVLAYASDLLSKVFRPDSEFLDIHYNIICPDFDAEAMKNVLSLMYHGKVYIQEDTNNAIYEEMRIILEILQIRIGHNSMEMVSGGKMDTLPPSLSEMSSNPVPEISKVLLPHECKYCDKKFHILEALDKHVTKHLTQVTVLPVATQNQLNPKSNQPYSKSNQPNPKSNQPYSKSNQPNPKSNQPNPKSNQPMPKSNQPNTSDGQANAEPDQNWIKTEATFQMDQQIPLHVVQVKMEPTDFLDNPGFACKSCPKRFLSAESLASHQLRRHTAKPKGSHRMPEVKEDPLSRLKCPICAAKIVNYHGVIIHMTRVHFYEAVKAACGPDKLSCVTCNKSFKSEVSTWYHAATVHKILEDNLTTEQLKYLQALRHKSSKSIQNKKSKSRLTLPVEKDTAKTNPMEKSIHNNSMPANQYECPKCKFITSNFSALQQHIAFLHFKQKIKSQFISPHQNNKAIKTCAICGASKSSTQSLIYHLVSKHEIVNQFMKTEPTEDQVQTPNPQTPPPKLDKAITDFACQFCNKVFSDQAEADQHLALTHFKEDWKSFFGQDPGDCSLCSNAVLDNNALKIHLVKSHKETLGLGNELGNKSSTYVQKKKIKLSKILPKLSNI